MTHGQRVIAGRYRLITAIGSGGAGVVWRARDDLLDRDVAVKEIARLAGADEPTRSESYTRTLREARAAARISHPGVAAVYDVVSEDGCPYIVMELIGGRPLSQLIPGDQPLPPAAVADIGRQVLAALMAGHAAGVLHRDLKPANVLITPDGRAVLTDFGIASVLGDPSITRTGVVVGTPGYLAPERIRGEPATPAADLWSLGATLYAAACGAGPYDGYDGAIATMYAVVSEDPPEPSVRGPLREIIDALLSRDPRLRPGAAEIARALDAAAGSRAAEPARCSEPVPGTAASGPWRGAAASGPAGGPWRGAAASGPLSAPAVEPPRTVTSDLPPVRTPGDGLSTLLEPPADDVTDVGGSHSGRVTPPVRSARSGPPGRPGLSGAGGRRGILVAGLAAAVAAAAVATTVTLGHHGTPRVGSAADVTPPALSEQFRVTPAANADGGTELFAVAGNGSLMRDDFANGSWSGWARLPGTLAFTGVPAVAKGADGRLAVFARTTGGQVAELWQASPGSRAWDGPATLGSETVSSAPAAVSWPDGHLEVFARLGDGSLGAVTQLNPADFGGWSSWSSLGGHLGSPPVAAVNSGGRPEVFAIASNGGLVHDYWANGSWAGWRALPGGQGFTGVPAVGQNQDGRLEVFVRTSSGAIEHVWQDPRGAGGWSGPGNVLISDAVRDPAVMSVNGGRLEIFVVVASGKMMHTWQIAPNGSAGWNTPESLGGRSDSAPAAIRVNGRSQLFARGPDRKIGYDHLDAPVGAWSGWSGLGGSF